MNLSPHIPSEGQELAIDFTVKNDYAIIAMPPGQGKTLCGVEITRRLGLNTLVVCPSYARKVWIKEYQHQIPGIQIENLLANTDIYEVWDDGVVIISYSLLLDRKMKPQTKRADWLFEWADLVISDESHLIKETDNKRSRAFHKLVYENRVSKVMLLSGTPAKNRIYELYSQIAICHYKHDDSKFLRRFPTWVSFANYFSYQKIKKVKTKRGHEIPQVVYDGFRNEEELGDILEECYFKLPDRLMHKLPERTTIHVEVDKLIDSPELITAFEEFSKQNTGVMPDIKAKAALQTAKFTAELAKRVFLKEGCVVVFTDHVESCIEIARVLEVDPIHGKIPIKKRQRILEDFQDGLTDFIVATVGTLSTAISLTVSNTMIMADFPWVPGDLEQAERRILRRGQENHCTYYYVMATKQSSKILDIINSKRRTLKKVDDLMESKC